MTIEEVEDLVSAAFAAAIAPTPVAWDAVEFDSNGVAEWCRFSMQFTSGTSAEVSGKVFRRFGIVAIQIFAPATSGKRRARQLAETVLATFEGKTIGPVRFRNIGVVDVGVEDAWYQSNVTANFEFDQFR